VAGHPLEEDVGINLVVWFVSDWSWVFDDFRGVESRKLMALVARVCAVSKGTVSNLHRPFEALAAIFPRAT
jgi:hypothetical protein